mmetsp:Transcript_3366/g.7984  ORF Transcript_3366/g.7984 Transcript_3366/m.7984 type:complete len:137 (+) Transcript_3366:337-747(+)|eukprot:1835202-Rhodomonas_salina.2
MSWVEIVHTGMLGSGFITTAAVLSPEGVQFAGTVGFKVLKEDFDPMAKAFHDHSDLFRRGLTLNGKKYVAISANPRIIHCKSGPSGVICMRALHCVLVGLYFPPVTAPQAVGTMESVADAINDGVYRTEKDADPQD